MSFSIGNHINFIRIKTKELFNIEKENINNDSIVFIEDTQEIYLDGKFYSNKIHIDDLTKEEVIEILQEEINNLTIDMLKKDIFADIWNNACGSSGNYNKSTGFFELNGLKDITYNEAIRIYNAGRLYSPNSESFYRNAAIRTNLPPLYYWNCCKLLHTCSVNSELEIFNGYRCSLAHSSFSGCYKLKKIIGIIYNDGNDLTGCFYECKVLEQLYIKCEKSAKSFSLAHSPLINYSSLKYIINNAINSNNITITVHPDVYAKLTGDITNNNFNILTEIEKEQWRNLIELAANKNIQFISA